MRIGSGSPSRASRARADRSGQQPRVAGVGGKQDKLAYCNYAPILICCPALNVANLVDQTKGLAIHHALARSTLDRFATPTVFAMELFTKLFGNLLTFVYHCFDRIVIHGYLSALSRPEQVVHFFRQVLGVPVVCKEILSQRTADYQNWWTPCPQSSYPDRVGREGVR